MWEKIYAYMTDVVSKNFEVEIHVSKQLGTDHIPIHLLCKSQTCEKLDEACINALVKIKNEIKYTDLIIAQQPQLKSFIRQSKCITIVAIKALLKLVSNEESAN